MFARGNVGLGQYVTDTILSATSGTDSATGLPVLVEIGIGILGSILLMRLIRGGQKAYKSVSAGRKKSRARSQRKAQLRAELAAL